MASKKTYDNKEDFIELLASMTQNEINEYIKSHGVEPKLIAPARVLTDEEYEHLKAMMGISA